MNPNGFSSDEGPTDLHADAKRAKRMRDQVMHGVDIKTVLEAGRSLGDTIRATTKTQPYLALGVAAAAGFGIGCVLGNRIGRIALGVGVSVITRKLLDEVDVRALLNKALAV